MRDQGTWGFPEVACRNCGLTIPVAVGVVRMGAADLFVCPRCNHQAVWRNDEGPAATRERSGVL